jgi:hypothetical protein
MYTVSKVCCQNQQMNIIFSVKNDKTFKVCKGLLKGTILHEFCAPSPSIPHILLKPTHERGTIMNHSYKPESNSVIRPKILKLETLS